MYIRCKSAAAAASWWLVIIAWCCSGLITAADDQETSTTTEELDTESQQQVAILKQINRVNDDGSYTFGYEAADGSFKIETRDVLGNVKGMFGFIDESGELKRVSYSASNKTGFQSMGTLAPGEDKDKTESSTKSPSTPPLLYQQIIRPANGGPNDQQSTTRRPLFRPTVTRESLTTTTVRPLDPSSRRPVLLYAQSIAPATATDTVETSTRPTVIQTIPRSRRPQEIPSSTEKPLFSTERPLISTTTRRPLQLYGQYIRQHPGIPGGQPIKQIYVTPAPVEEAPEHPQTSTVPTSGIVYGHYVNPTQSPEATVPGQLLRRVVLARRPAAVTESTESTAALHAKQTEEKKEKQDEKKEQKGNALRRQLSQDRSTQSIRTRQSGTDDTGDVYGGSIGGSPRPIPATPFRSLFTTQQPRAAQSSVLQSQLLQGIPDPRQIPPGYLQDDLSTRVPPGAIPSGVGGSIRIPLGVIKGGVLDPRVPPGAFQYTPPPGYQYLSSRGPDPDLQEHLLQLLLGRQVPRQAAYDYPYRQQTPVQQLTPFQLALMMTLGENIPPELLDDPYQPLNRQQPAYNPQQVPYNRQVPYPIAYNPQQAPYPPQQSGYPAQQPGYPAQQPGYPSQQPGYPAQQPGYSAIQPGGPYGQTPYNPSLPYDPQQAPVYPPQQYPPYYPGQLPYQGQLPYYIRRRLRYRPQPIYPQGLPFPNGQQIPPDFYQQPLPYPGRNPVVGYPQELLPDEYRDALILRMLLAARGAQGRVQPRPIEQNPNIQERAQPYFTTEGTATSTTTVRPRTLAPVRNVQILDPITEETQAKRSTEKPPPRS